MKNTIPFYLIAALSTACLLLQNDGVAIAASSDTDSITVSAVPMLVAEAGGTNENKNNKIPPGHDDSSHAGSNKRRPLEPAIHRSVKGLVNTSHEGLVEEKTSKGVELKLKGRFRTAPVAIINEDGTVTVRDYTAVPPAE